MLGDACAVVVLGVEPFGINGDHALFLDRRLQGQRRRIRAALAERRIDQRIRHPQRGALHLAVTQTPDVFQNHVRLDAVDDRQRLVQTVAYDRSQQRNHRLQRVLENAHAMAAAVRLFPQKPCALQAPLLQRRPV